MEDSERIGGCQLRAGRRDLQVIGLVLAEFLHRLARAGGLDAEVGGAIRGILPDGNPCFPRECRQEAVAGQREPGLRISLEGDVEISVDQELALGGFDVRG